MFAINFGGPIPVRCIGLIVARLSVGPNIERPVEPGCICLAPDIPPAFDCPLPNMFVLFCILSFVAMRAACAGVSWPVRSCWVMALLIFAAWLKFIVF